MQPVPSLTMSAHKGTADDTLLPQPDASPSLEDKHTSDDIIDVEEAWLAHSLLQTSACDRPNITSPNEYISDFPPSPKSTPKLAGAWSSVGMRHSWLQQCLSALCGASSHIHIKIAQT